MTVTVDIEIVCAECNNDLHGHMGRGNVLEVSICEDCENSVREESYNEGRAAGHEEAEEQAELDRDY